MHDVETLRLANPEDCRRLHALLCEGEVVALVGSAVSIFPPTSIPAGQTVTRALAATLADGALPDAATLGDLVVACAFEHVMECCPAPDKILDRFTREFHPRPSNPVHEGFARLLGAGRIRHVVTTNYDTGLEAACAGTGADPAVVVEEDDLAGVDPGGRAVIFKVHGCARRDLESPAGPRTMVYTLGGEAELPQWKRALLASLVGGRTLLVCGYSGLDFELCPELVGARPRRAIWLELPRYECSVSANAKRVLRATGGCLLLGDFSALLEELGQKAAVGPPGGGPELVEEMFAALDGYEREMWRARLCNAMGAGRQARHVLRRMPPEHVAEGARRTDWMLEHAQASFHLGRYREAACEYESAAGLAEAAGDFDRWSTGQLGAAEAERCAGRWIRGWRRLGRLSARVEALDDPEMRGEKRSAVALARAVYVRPAYGLARRAGLAGWIRRYARGELERVAAHSAAKGKWSRFQQSRMAAERLGIAFSTVYAGPMVPLPPREGYGQLGYVVAESIALRSELGRGEAGEDALERAREILALAEAIGAWGELWKLSAALRRARGPGALTAEQEALAARARAECEYTVLVRGVRRLLS